MKVTLINFTGMGHLDPYFAARLLIFTKNTRLNMTAANFDEVNKLDAEEIIKQLKYMANTIPSSWEFVDYTFAVEGVTRAYTHQQVRTREGSYAQQSMRVTDMSGFKVLDTTKTSEGRELYSSTCDLLQGAYDALINVGEAEEDARGILPTNILTNIVCKFNLRTLSNLVRSREGGRTQDEYREVIRAMGTAVLEVHPWADLFLYPKGRDYWLELEEAVAKAIPGLMDRGPILKIIDKMRKA